MDSPTTRVSCIVPAAQAGLRLDVFVGEMDEVGSRSRAAEKIGRGLVTVGGKARSRSYRLREGEVVGVTLSAPPAEQADDEYRRPQPEDIPVGVVFEDEWLMVVDKPAGLVVHPARGHASGTLVNALLGKGLAGGDAGRPGIVHRLDKDTSGLMLVVKDEPVHRQMVELIKAREVQRRYLALVHGSPAAATGTIDAPIGRDRRDRKAMAVGGSGSREAVTHFAVLERLPGFTLVEARLETGRTHQIRVHFLAIGHPVAGDPTYGRRDPLGVGRQFLHSHRLTFRHPVTDELMDVSSTLPDDLAQVLSQLRR